MARPPRPAPRPSAGSVYVLQQTVRADFYCTSNTGIPNTTERVSFTNKPKFAVRQHSNQGEGHRAKTLPPFIHFGLLAGCLAGAVVACLPAFLSFSLACLIAPRKCSRVVCPPGSRSQALTL